MTTEKRGLRKAALEQFPNALSVSHPLPTAYCVAADGLWAVFAVPPCDREPPAACDPWVVLSGEAALGARVGSWYALAYVVTAEGGGMRVVAGY
jgi:hypothetical protein